MLHVVFGVGVYGVVNIQSAGGGRWRLAAGSGRLARANGKWAWCVTEMVER